MPTCKALRIRDLDQVGFVDPCAVCDKADTAVGVSVLSRQCPVRDARNEPVEAGTQPDVQWEVGYCKSA